MYLDVTDFIDDEKTIDKINEDLKLGDTLKVEKVPAIIYYKDGVATKTIDSKDHILQPGDIQQIIDIYEFFFRFVKDFVLNIIFHCKPNFLKAFLLVAVRKIYFW